MHHQHAATPTAHAGQEPVKHLALAFPAEQLASWRPNRSAHSA
jgi:hypothetical protein